ncbi:hypothetical protein L3476_09625 [Paenibacillus thiaminolyticus]|uniref:hypothetical protein n=1 Tax=Paenibacillus thiaminolyticus TaxID=49283 RepID=UPI0011626B8B|nr:hypothetical protein [Paenibacillus thiaminolyticus]NGP58873.1 hypothetical protein [Paenibacillus thiaminolyticus]WCR28951.1 hypothetical protein L3476_09625 [Paenibacillus thiaminolyticus]
MHTTSLCFGGPSYRELYVTTARTGMKVEQLEQEPYAGGVFRVEPGVAGLPRAASMTGCCRESRSETRFR